MINSEIDFIDLKFSLYSCHSFNQNHKGVAYEFRQDNFCSDHGFSPNLRI
jgi:hypothetical protein